MSKVINSIHFLNSKKSPASSYEQVGNVSSASEQVGLLSYPPKQNGDPEFVRPHSEETARIMDREKKRLVDDQYAFVKTLLLEHETKLKELADRLLLKEVRP